MIRTKACGIAIIILTILPTISEQAQAQGWLPQQDHRSCYWPCCLLCRSLSPSLPYDTCPLIPVERAAGRWREEISGKNGKTVACGGLAVFLIALSVGIPRRRS